MIAAVLQLIDQRNDIKHHTTGSGEYEVFMRERVRERGVEAYFKFLGHVPDERANRESQEAELFVLPCIITTDGDRILHRWLWERRWHSDCLCLNDDLCDSGGDH